MARSEAALRRRQGGFTFAELTLAAVLVGILALVIGSQLQYLAIARTQTYRNQQDLINQRIAAGLLQDAELNNGGVLRAPYSSGAFISAVYNPADATLQATLTQNGVSAFEINDDGRASQRVRVYQRVALTTTVPVFGLTGDSADVTYHYGVIYLTACPRSNASCNVSPLPGDSPALTAGNLTTWTTAGNDLPAVHLSTLPLVRARVRAMTGNLNVLRDRLRAFFTARQLSGPPDATTNYYPNNTASGGPNLAGANRANNQGCHDGWYNLAAADVNIVEQLGLSKAELAVTPWGGSVQYCRDYEPAASGPGTPNGLPHSAALRILRDVTSGGAPAGGAGAAASNIFFPL